MKFLKPIQILLLVSAPSCLLGMSSMEQANCNMQQFENFVVRAMEKYHVPGTSVAIIQNGKIAYARGFGHRDVEHKLPVNPETIFAIGSCTKAFTATALGVLVDQGRLDWDAPIKKYLPNFAMYDPHATEQLSIRDCLCHRSGLPRDVYDCLIDKFKSRAELVATLKYLKPTAQFREKFQYNNLIYALAGNVLENISGMPWEAFVRRFITEPLGMHNTCFSASVIPTHPNAALAYEFDKETQSFKHVDYNNLDVIAPAGSIHSNVLDMAQWVIMNLQHGASIVSAKTMSAIHMPQIGTGGTNDYCFGWFHDNSENIYIHSGGTTGCSSLVIFMPTQNIGFVALANIEDADDFNESLFKYLYACMIGDSTKVMELEEQLSKTTTNESTETSSTEKPAFQAIAPTQAAEFAGTFHNNVFGDVVINSSGSELKCACIAETLDLGCIDKDTLKQATGEWIFRFKRNSSGLPDRFELEIEEGCSYEFVKI